MAFTKITAAGIGSTETVTLDGLSVINDVSIGGTLTYEDVTNVDSVGLITARNGIVVGSGITLSKDGDGFFTGIVTATSFVGSGAELTGVASTENIRTNTNATFLQNVTVVGTSTVTGNIVPSSDSATDIGTNSVRFQNAYVDTYYGDGSNLTGIAATANVRTGILDVAGIATFRNNVNVPNINGGQIGGRRNLIINGAMQIAQRSTSAVTIAGGKTWTDVDRFGQWTKTAEGSWKSGQQVSDAPTDFQYSRKITSLAASTVTSSSYHTVRYSVEGYDAKQLNCGFSSAKTVTLSFYVKSSLTGTFGLNFTNAANSRSYATSYTISAADTWEQKTITLTLDTTGTWPTTTGVGLEINWALAIGSSYQTSTLNQWQGNWRFPDTGANTLMTTNGATFQLTGVQLEVGSQATAFEHLSYAEELALCQRYFYKIIGTSDDMAAIGFAQSSSDNYFNMEFPVPMRDYPTLTGSATPARLFGSNNGQDFNLDSLSLSSNMTNANPKRVMLYVNQGGTSGGIGGALHFQNQEGFLEFSAEI